MDRFVSHFSNRLDSKGRVSIPAPYRAVLARDGFEGLYVHPALDTDAVDCGGHGLLKDIDTLLDRHAPYSVERDLFSTALLGTSEILKVDSEGRVVLTEMIRDHTGITGEVTFVGQGHKFQIWEPAKFRVHLEEAKLRLRELRITSGSRTMAATPGPPGARE